ncbi:hypothetical protein [Inquilinus sp.]|jgi:hypothetical protein|uniref:hypothetical protein n=1 Tax=Inquilinus sp. TaxID=1932117 RepID=UPI003784AD9F
MHEIRLRPAMSVWDVTFHHWSTIGTGSDLLRLLDAIHSGLRRAASEVVSDSLAICLPTAPDRQNCSILMGTIRSQMAEGTEELRADILHEARTLIGRYRMVQLR